MFVLNSKANVYLRDIKNMRTRTLRPENERLGCWCAYVEDGATKDERRFRLSQSPKQHRKNIVSHCQTVAALKGLSK